jgi:acetoin utilization protein AcuC
MAPSRAVYVYTGDEIGRYGFGGDHPFCNTRIHAFWDEMHTRDLSFQVRIMEPVIASEKQLLLFHTQEYIDKVKHHSLTGDGLLDHGDTPAYKGVFEDASYIVGTVLDAVYRVMTNEMRRAFVPIAGLHHGMPDSASGFCVFNDVGVAIKVLEDIFGLERIAYIDIDAHHGDGIYYPYEADPRVIFADIHEDGRYIFPQSGFAYEVGTGEAKGKKLNIPLLPLSADADFFIIWPRVEEFVRQWRPQFIILNCGADGLNDDPLSHLHYSPRIHAKAAESLCHIAEEFAEGRIVAVGGGGYDLHSVGKAWAAVVNAFLETPVLQDT